MRKLMLFTIGFAVGCAIGVYFLADIWMIIAAILSLVSFLLLILFHPGKRRKTAAIIILGVAISLIWTFGYDWIYVRSARQLDGKTEKVSIEATDFLTKEDYRYSCTGKVIIDGKPYKVQFTIYDYLEIFPGDVIKGEFTFRFTGDQDENSSKQHQGKGIQLIAFASEEISHQPAKNIPIKYFAVLLRRIILKQLHSIFPKDQVGFACALLLGDTSNLSFEQDAALKISGIRHIVAVSGLHVSILISFCYVFSKGNRYIHAAISLPLLFVFAAIAGFTPSIVRACVMQGIMIIGILFDREYDAPSSLSTAVLILLAFNPFTITSISFQLSVGCVIGILLFSKKIHDVLLRTKLGPAKGRSLKSKLIRAVVGSVSISLSAMVFTIPISAWYFGSVSLISVVTNFLTLWLVSICFYGVVVCCTISFVLPSVATIGAWFVSWPMRLILFIAKQLSNIPFASVSVHNIYFLLSILFCYVLFALFLLIKKKKPFLFVSLAGSALAFSMLFAYIEPRLDYFRMTVLDVGQGQCVILQSKNSCYIVDCGGDYSAGTADLAAQTLRSCGTRKVDGLILTHFDYDHSGGVEYLLSQMQVDRIYAPVYCDEEPDYEYKKVRRETVLNCGKGKISIFPGEKGKNGNESSLCILFQANNCDILITGDRNHAGEQHLLENYSIPKLDVLVAGHHGADSSTSLQLLRETMPSTVVISVGKNNRYNHPNAAVLRRLKDMGCVIWRTDIDGTIVIRG